MSAVAFPYLRLSAEAVDADVWRFAEGDPVPDVLPHWDYTRDVEIERVVRLDMVKAAEDLMISPAELRLGAVVACGSGGASGQRDRRIMARGAFNAIDASLKLRLALPGAELSLALALMTDIVLERKPRTAGRLSPQHPGLRLWSDRTTIQLETSASRFPIEAADFGVLFPGHAGQALFHLDCGEDLDYDFAGAVRLLINSAQPDFVARVEAGDPITLKLMLAHAMSQIVRQALLTEDFHSTAAEPGTVAAVAAAWIELAFPAHPLDTVRAMARHDAASFETAMGALAAAMVARDG